ALRGRDRGLAAAALGAARDRGAVGAPRQRAALGDAVAAGRRGAARARHVRAGDPGERQGARPAGGAGRAPGRRAGRAREGVHARAGAPGRQGDPPDDRRARQAREPGRRLRPRELRGAAAAFASAPPVGPLPSAVTAVKTTRGALFSVALPKRAGGYVWRIARPFNLRVARQASEADVGPTVVLAFRAVGRGRTAIVVAERRGARPRRPIGRFGTTSPSGDRLLHPHARDGRAGQAEGGVGNALERTESVRGVERLARSE